MSVVRLGLIGAGRWGCRYIHTLNGMEGVELARLASGNPESRNLVPAGCAITTDWREVAEDAALDGVILATPPALHAEMAEAAMTAGLPVLIEKPLTLSLADAQRLVRSSRETGCLAMVGHTHLFSAAFRALKRQATALGALRELRSAGGNWGPYRSDAPMLWDWAPHDLSMCLDLVGASPVAVDARQTETAALPGGVGEAVEISLEFPEGVRAGIRVSNIDRQKTRRFEASFEKGGLVYDDLSAEKLCFYPRNGADRIPVPFEPSMPLSNQLAEFCAAIRSGQSFHASLDLGLQVIRILDRCQQALDRARSGSAPTGIS